MAQRSQVWVCVSINIKSSPEMICVTSHTWEALHCGWVTMHFSVRRRRERQSKHKQWQCSMDSPGSFWKKSSTRAPVCGHKRWKHRRWGQTAIRGSRRQGWECYTSPWRRQGSTGFEAGGGRTRCAGWKRDSGSHSSGPQGGGTGECAE